MEVGRGAPQQVLGSSVWASPRPLVVPACLCVSTVSKLPFYKDTSHWIRASLPVDLNLTDDISNDPVFKVTF